MRMENRDLVVVGGGPAGYVAAIRARQLGARVTLIEESALGGLCLNRGCIPMKVLLRGAEFAEAPRKAKDYGVDLDAAQVDLGRMIARKDMVVRTVTGGVRLLLEGNGVEVVAGRGRLVSASAAEVMLPDGSVTSVESSSVLIATGASPARPRVSGGDKVLTTDDALTLTEIPPSMLILGGRAIGLGFATIFSRLGTEVTIAEESARLLPEMDAEIVSALERDLRRQKIKVLVSAVLKEVREAPGGGCEVVLSVGGEEVSIGAQCVLAADDRKTNLEGLGLEELGVDLHREGIRVDSRMRTSVPGVLAAGDVVGEPRLAHAAFAEGRIAAENALGKEAEMDYSAVPRCISVMPEIASVGLTEEEATSRGYQVRVGRFPLAANGMATALGERSGLVKVVSEAQYGQVLGVHIIGPHAGEIIGEAVLAMKLEAITQEVGTTAHTHPTISEALMEAALDVAGGAIHNLSEGG